MAEKYLDVADQKRAVDRLTNTLSKWIQWIAAGLAMTFAFLEFQNAPIDKITQVFDTHSFTKFGLFLFFTGWAFGATDDTKIQKFAYAVDPDEGKIGLKEYAGIAVFLIFFSLLFIFHEKLIVFQSLLLFFICANMWTYSSVIMKRAEKIIRESEVYYKQEKDNFSYFKLYTAVEYLTGRWQKRRFITLFMLALMQLLVAIYLNFWGVPSVLSGLSIKGVKFATALSYAPSVLFVAYVIISEGWMKIYRYKVFSDFETIEQMRDYFNLSRQAKSDLPRINYDNLFFSGLNKNANYH